VVLRLLILKHAYHWSFQTLEREVRANVVYRTFTRIGGHKAPDAKTMGRLAQALPPELIQQIHERVVGLAREHKVVRGRKMRVDTTVVETNIHYPTDSSLLGDGVRVLTRVMQQVSQAAVEAGTQWRDRTRSVGRQVLQIIRVSRVKGEPGQAKLKACYQKLLASVAAVVGQAKRFCQELADGTKRARRGMATRLRRCRRELEEMLPRVQQVMRQTRARLLRGDTRSPEKLASLFEPSTEIIRRGKAARPTEFGKRAKIQEAENQIIVDYQVFARKPSDSNLLLPSIREHMRKLGRVPHLVAANAAFYSAKNESEAQALGVKRVAIPNRHTKSPERKQLQRRRWFREGQRWRTGCEGRISVLKNRHGLHRCRYKGEAGMQRWVGWGVIADNLINIGRKLAAESTA
jgi:IS5 family transposase